MAETIRDVVVRLSLKQVEAKLRTPDMKPAEKAVQGYEKTVVKSTKVVEKHFTSVRESVKEMTTETVDGSLKMSESLRTAGDGAFTLARGLAFTWAGSQEDMQKALQTIAKFQGSFDVFRGGVDVIKGSIDAWRAYKLVTTATTAAQSALTAATIAQTTATEAGMIATIAATVAANPFKAAIAAAGAAAVTAGGYYLLFGQRVDEAADAVERLDGAAKRSDATLNAGALRSVLEAQAPAAVQLIRQRRRRRQLAIDTTGAFERGDTDEGQRLQGQLASTTASIFRLIQQSAAEQKAAAQTEFDSTTEQFRRAGISFQAEPARQAIHEAELKKIDEAAVRLQEEASSTGRDTVRLLERLLEETADQRERMEQAQAQMTRAQLVGRQ